MKNKIFLVVVLLFVGILSGYGDELSAERDLFADLMPIAGSDDIRGVSDGELVELLYKNLVRVIDNRDFNTVLKELRDGSFALTKWRRPEVVDGLLERFKELRLRVDERKSQFITMLCVELAAKKGREEYFRYFYAKLMSTPGARFSALESWFDNELRLIACERVKEAGSGNGGILDELLENTYVSDEYLASNQKTRDEAQSLLGFVYRKIMDADSKLFNMMHVMALNMAELGKRHYLMSIELERSIELEGAYAYYDHYTGDLHFPIDDCVSCSIIAVAHEMGHGLMDVLFNNLTVPYGLNGSTQARDAYKRAIKEIEESIAGNDYPEGASQSYRDSITRLRLTRDRYPESAHEVEYIVCLVERLLDSNYENDLEVRQLYKPLHEYWEKYIDPEIEAYIAKRAQSAGLFQSYSADFDSLEADMREVQVREAYEEFILNKGNESAYQLAWDLASVVFEYWFARKVFDGLGHVYRSYRYLQDLNKGAY